MLKTVFKIQDSETGKYWNGNSAWPMFNNVGHRWTRKSSLEHDLTWYVTTAKKKDPDAQLPSSWRVIELELIQSVKKVNNLDQFMFTIMLKAELNKIGWRFASFYNVMETRNAADDIEFILKLKPNVNERFVSTEKILESRAQLRLLGVKTRTFREFSGMFGMMNREQAMRAKLALDVECSVDLGELRNRIKDSIQNDVSKETAVSTETMQEF